MPFMRRLALLLICALWLAACSTVPTHPSLLHLESSTVQLPPLVPVRSYIADWDGSGDYQLSPDGKQLMWAARKGLHQGLFIKNLQTGAVHSYTLPVTGFWAEDSRHILLQLHNGDENSNVFQFDSFQDKLQFKPISYVAGARTLVHSTIENSDDLLITSNRRDPKVFDLYRYDARSAALNMVAQNPGNVGAWLTNRQGQLLGRTSKEANGKSYAIYTPQTDPLWRKVFTVDLQESLEFLFWQDNAKLAWALSNRGRDKMALVQLDLESGEETVFLADPRVDISQVLMSRKTGQPLAASLHPDMQEWKFFDAQLQGTVRRLLGTAPQHIELQSMSRDETKAVWVVQDDAGGRTLLVDSQQQRSTLLGELSSSRIHAISPLPQRRAIAFASRDGLQLHGYLTTPIAADGTPLKHLPTVLLVHGGPWARDYWNDRGMAQFLANRGYAVLQVNFRGSSGYGRAFMQAAMGEFAGKMHTDLLDGLAFLQAQGVSDLAKVAIVGASYGGYASMVGMTHTPGHFACGVSLFGVSDLSRLIEDAPAHWNLEMHKWYAYVGDPAVPEDLQRMKEQSPLFRTEQVRGPLLLLQGTQDARVHVYQASRMVQALQQHGKAVDYVLFPYAGHSLPRWIDRLTYYRKTEDFLAQCLGGRSAGFDFFELGKLIY